MSNHVSLGLALGVTGCLFSGPLPAQTEPPENEQLPMTPPASDTLSRHISASLSLAAGFSLGRLAEDLWYRDRVGAGLQVGADLGYGVSRQVVIGVAGSWLSAPGAGGCNDCSLSSVIVNPMVRYHLVQGLRLDPWVSIGVGYRFSNLEVDSVSSSFRGFEWLKLGVGGDWYALRSVGLGPFLSGSVGAFDQRPEGVGKSAVHWELACGLRVALDVPGR